MYQIKSRIPKIKKKHIYHPARIAFWFTVGASLALFFVSSFAYLIFQNTYKDVVYPGVIVDGKDFGEQSKEDVRNFFSEKNSLINKTTFVFNTDKQIATVSAGEIEYGFDEDLLAEQAYDIGRSKNTLSNITLVLQAYFHGVNLPSSYSYSREKLDKLLLPLEKDIKTEPVDAVFTFTDGKVTAFKQSVDGREVDKEKLLRELESKTLTVMASNEAKVIIISVPIKITKPNITTEKVNNLGIKELIGEGKSTFYGSIPNRAYNIGHAAGKLNGVLVKPGETFSFNKTIGDISSLTGYKQAYVISGGKTILGDGGGVCQVSTTFFRSLLNAGLPILERNAHAYRVSYYEQDSLPGVDAAIYVPTVDLKFKNDTDHHILIQARADLVNYTLSFSLYGTKDGREITINKPVITSQSPAPPAEYQDDPTLPKGTTKQVDFSAPGARVFFTREVKKDGKVIISDNFVSNYRPWKAIYLVGTKEN